MFQIAEILKKYNEETEKYTEKIAKIEKQIKEANQQKIIIEQESVSNRCKLLQEALTIIEQTSEEPAIKTFVARCRQFISPREMWLVIMRLDEIGVKNIKVGGLLGRFGAEYIEDEVLTVRVISGYKNILRVGCNHQTGTIYKIEVITDIDC